MSYKGNSELVPFTLTGLNFTNTLSTAYYRQISSTLLEVRIRFTMIGTPGAATLSWNPVPTGFTYDNTKSAIGVIHGIGGFAYDSSAAYAIYGPMHVAHYNTGTVGVLASSTAAAARMGWMAQNFPFAFAVNDIIYLTYIVPIL